MMDPISWSSSPRKILNRIDSILISLVSGYISVTLCIATGLSLEFTEDLLENLVAYSICSAESFAAFEISPVNLATHWEVSAMIKPEPKL